MGDKPWIVVPSAGRDCLTEAVDSTGIPRERTVIVATADFDPPAGCMVVRDSGELNIQRWWNAGLDAVAERGGRFACVINDDAILTPDVVPALLEAMQSTGATLASPGQRCHFVDVDRLRPRSINGACWLLDLSHGIRPDETYRWWFGDNDIDWRARRDGGGVVLVPVDFRHLHANHLTETTPALLALTELDARRWSQE